MKKILITFFYILIIFFGFFNIAKASTISINGVANVFINDNTKRCQIDKYIQNGSEPIVNQYCDEYNDLNTVGNPGNGEDLLKGLEITIGNDPSGISNINISLGNCDTTYTSSIGTYTTGFTLKYNSTINALGKIQASLLNAFGVDRLDKCLSEGKNNLVIDVNNKVGGSTNYTLPGYIYIDNSVPELQLLDDLNKTESSNTFYNSYNYFSGWRNYTLEGNIKQLEEYQSGRDNECNLTEINSTCPQTLVEHQFFSSPFGVNPYTGKYKYYKCGNITVSDTTCETQCEEGYFWNEFNSTCMLPCGIDYYLVGASCVSVGIGYYSPDKNNNRYSCTTKPSYSTYTSDGNGTNSCSRACNTDYYKSGTSCLAVGIGYYSPNINNTRYSCTNSPSDSNSRDYYYISDGNGLNNCFYTYSAKCGLDYYESSSGICSSVGIGYYSPINNNTRYSCTGKPSYSNYTSDGNGTNSCSRACTTDYYKSGSYCYAVGTGYYSPYNNNYRYPCTNSPSDSNSRNYYYTSDGNGSNSCSYTYSAKCGTDYYESSYGVCSPVGIGYYSPINNNSRYSCTVKPAYSSYTTDGNGINNCSWACTTDYYKYGSYCYAVGIGYYSPYKNNIRYSCTNKPAYSSYTTDGNGINNCSWACTTDYYKYGSYCYAVGIGYYSPYKNNTRYSCTNKPSYAIYTSDGNGSNNCSRKVTSSWTTKDPNCKIADIVIGTQTWAGCNSTLGNGVSYYDDEGDGNVCRNYNYTSPSGTNCIGYNTKESTYKPTYGVNNIWGKLYTYENAASACPSGRHVPSDNEWKTLENNLYGSICRPLGGASGSYACNGLGWKATTVLTPDRRLVEKLLIPLAGYRPARDKSYYDPINFIYRGSISKLWTSSVSSGNYYYVTLARNYTGVGHYPTTRKYEEYSVRCLKD